MLDWIAKLLGCRRKSTSGPEVTAAIVRRDKLFADAEDASDIAKEAMIEVDRVKDRLLKDYEDAEKLRRGDA